MLLHHISLIYCFLLFILFIIIIQEILNIIKSKSMDEEMAQANPLNTIR